MASELETDKLAKDFNEESFWDKVQSIAKRAGRELIEKALWLFYAAQSANTPLWAKTTIYGALAYLILPVDVIPDFIPVIGLTDDAGALAAALAIVAAYVDDDVKEQANAKLTTWFG